MNINQKALFCCLLIFAISAKKDSHQEDHLLNLYNQMSEIKDYVSQLDFYTALEQLEKRTEVDILFEQENRQIYLEHYEDLQHAIELLNTALKKESEDVQFFLKDTFPNVIDKLKRIIIDKEKLIESDVREISKLKSAAQLQEDSNKKLEEFTYLQQRIVEVFDEDDINEFYKTLELLESKVMIGLFKEPHVELAHFMKGVDYIFKNRDTQKREDLLSLLTIMQSIIAELRIKILSEQVEQQIDVLDKQIFYAQSKHTHNIARDDLLELLHKLESIIISYKVDYIPSWRNVEEHRESAGLLEAISFSSEKAEKIATRSLNYHISLQSTINSMIERFLQR